MEKNRLGDKSQEKQKSQKSQKKKESDKRKKGLGKLWNFEKKKTGVTIFFSH